MTVLNKEKYLLQVKNAMLLHFGHKDIYFTLEDLNLYFESGKKNNKTEEELYNEFGKPKEFVGELRHEKARDRFKIRLLIYIIGVIALLTVSYRMYDYRDFTLLRPSLMCIPPVIMSIFVWHFLGGRCMFKVKKESTGYLKKYGVFYMFSLTVVAMEQIYTVLLNKSVKIANSTILITYRLSNVLIFVSVLVMVIAVYATCKGYFLSLGVLSMSIGAVCSAMLYNDLLKRFIEPGPLSYIIALPYVASVIWFALYCRYAMKRQEA